MSTAESKGVFATMMLSPLPPCSSSVGFLPVLLTSKRDQLDALNQNPHLSDNLDHAISFIKP
jgi:hypothetical protein